jgi:hypothetical protein
MAKQEADTTEAVDVSVEMKSGAFIGETVDFGKRHVKKDVRLEENDVQFSFSTGEGFGVSLEDFPAEVQKYLTLMGISSVLGDAYAGAKTAEDKVFSFTNKLEALKEGRMTIRKASAGGDLDTLRAVASYKGLDHTNDADMKTIRENLVAAAKQAGQELDELLSGLSKVPEIKAIRAQIVADRQKAKAEKAENTEEAQAAIDALSGF